MSWFPVDDAFHSHPKARKAGMEAIGLWTLAGSHCMAYLTDGFVADWWVKEKPKGAALAKRLVAANLWHRGESEDGEQGYWFHDWKPECLKVNVLAAREKARQRKAKSRESQRESRVTDPVTDDVSTASCLGPTQPNPTQPINPGVDLGGGVTQVDAREPRPHCSRHPKENSKGPCPACASRREWDEADEKRRKDDELTSRRIRREAIDACGMCDQNGKREINRNTVIDCDHQERAHA